MDTKYFISLSDENLLRCLDEIDLWKINKLFHKDDFILQVREVINAKEQIYTYYTLEQIAEQIIYVAANRWRAEKKNWDLR